MNNKQRVLGVDPGIARMGWAILDAGTKRPALIGCGCLETPSTSSTADRLATLYTRLDAIIRESQPSALAIEKLFFTKNVTTGITVGQARGVVLLLAAQHKLRIEEFTPTAVKSAVCGDGRADKRQIGKMVQLLLGLKRLPQHDDTTDAIAIALCAASVNVLH